MKKWTARVLWTKPREKKGVGSDGGWRRRGGKLWVIDLNCQGSTQSESAGCSFPLLDPLTLRVSAWDEIHQVFGDGSDYAWALEDDNEYDEELQQQKLDMKYTDVREPFFDFSLWPTYLSPGF